MTKGEIFAGYADTKEHPYLGQHPECFDECSVYWWIPACAGMTSRSGNNISSRKMFTNNLFPYHSPVYHPKSLVYLSAVIPSKAGIHPHLP
ncbi:MAG: hypothetical protein JXB07_22385, partial [Anaerolineae bacterium]|nr:hypothetical protein [Anaerolineae bacterium]